MKLPTLATYKPGCAIVSSPRLNALFANKSFSPKGFKALMLLMSPQGFACAGVSAINPAGFKSLIASYEDQYFRVSFDPDDWPVFEKAIVRDTAENPAWIDEYAKQFFKHTKRLIPLAREIFARFDTDDLELIRQRFIDVVDCAVAANSYGFLTDVFFDMPWAIGELKKLAPDLSQEQVSMLLAPAAPSFVQTFQQRLRSADTDKKLQAVLDEFYWVKGSYFALPIITIEDLRKEAQGLPAEDSEYAKNAKKKKEIIALAPNPDALRAFVHVIETCISMQDERKANVLRLNYALLKLAQLISKAYPEWSVDDLLSFTPHEILDLFDGKIQKDHKAFIKERNARSAWIITGTEYCITTDPAVVDRVLKAFEEKKQDVKGFCACKGKVKGIVKVVLSEDDFGKIKEGDILVTSMTRPEFMPIMRKAAAFVTNEGGITCHAAIVSRELGKPCIIGTKTATKMLKDGDRVEVDADKGVVRKI